MFASRSDEERKSVAASCSAADSRPAEPTDPAEPLTAETGGGRGRRRGTGRLAGRPPGRLRSGRERRTGRPCRTLGPGHRRRRQHGPAQADRRQGPRPRPEVGADSASLFFASDREERGTAQLQRILLDGSEDVAKAEALTSWRGGICRPLAARRRPHRRAARRGRTNRGGRTPGGRARRRQGLGRHLPRTRLRLLDLETGALRTVDGLGDRACRRAVPASGRRPAGGTELVHARTRPRRPDGGTASGRPGSRQPSRTWGRSESRPSPRPGGSTTVSGIWRTWQ